MTRTTSTPSKPAFVVDVHNMDRSYGGHIDWTKVPNAAPYARPDGSKTIPAGTILSRDGAGKRFPREQADINANPTQTAQEIAWNDIHQNAKEDSHKAYAFIVGGVLWKNLLAKHHVDHASFATFLTELRAAGTGFRFETYVDSRAS